MKPSLNRPADGLYSMARPLTPNRTTSNTADTEVKQAAPERLRIADINRDSLQRERIENRVSRATNSSGNGTNLQAFLDLGFDKPSGQIGSGSSATLTIDDDEWTIEVEATDRKVGEPAPHEQFVGGRVSVRRLSHGAPERPRRHQ